MGILSGLVVGLGSSFNRLVRCMYQEYNTYMRDALFLQRCDSSCYAMPCYILELLIHMGWVERGGRGWVELSSSIHPSIHSTSRLTSLRNIVTPHRCIKPTIDTERADRYFNPSRGIPRLDCRLVWRKSKYNSERDLSEKGSGGTLVWNAACAISVVGFGFNNTRTQEVLSVVDWCFTHR